MYTYKTSMPWHILSLYVDTESLLLLKISLVVCGVCVTSVSSLFSLSCAWLELGLGLGLLFPILSLVCMARLVWWSGRYEFVTWLRESSCLVALGGSVTYWYLRPYHDNIDWWPSLLNMVTKLTRQLQSWFKGSQSHTLSGSRRGFALDVAHLGAGAT